jgi:hypothetical protein
VSEDRRDALASLIARVETDLRETCPPGTSMTYALIRSDDVRALLRALQAQASEMENTHD